MVPYLQLNNISGSTHNLQIVRRTRWMVLVNQITGRTDLTVITHCATMLCCFIRTFCY